MSTHLIRLTLHDSRELAVPDEAVETGAGCCQWSNTYNPCDLHCKTCQWGCQTGCQISCMSKCASRCQGKYS